MMKAHGGIQESIRLNFPAYKLYINYTIFIQFCNRFVVFQKRKRGFRPVSLNLETFQLTQICDASRKGCDPLQQAQPIFLYSFILGHDQHFVEEGGDGWDEFGDSFQELIDIVER